MKEEEREFVKLGEKEMLLMKFALDIKTDKCHYCKETIKKTDKFGIWNKPTRLICNSPLCIGEALEEDGYAEKIRCEEDY